MAERYWLFGRLQEEVKPEVQKGGPGLKQADSVMLPESRLQKCSSIQKHCCGHCNSRVILSVRKGGDEKRAKQFYPSHMIKLAQRVGFKNHR